MRQKDQNFWIFLCFGQSNMAGQAPIEQQDLTVSDRFLSMATTDGPDRRLGTWRKAVPPLCRADAHLGPADWFGRTLLEAVPEDVRIGIVSVAVEGCLPCEDNLHFNGDGYRLLGRHYALRYLEATNPQLAEVCRQKLAAAGLDKGGTTSSKLSVETKRSGETLSVIASEPVEKVDVVSFSGQTVKTFTLNGKKDFNLSLKDLPKEKLVFVFQSAGGKATTDVDI